MMFTIISDMGKAMTETPRDGADPDGIETTGSPRLQPSVDRIRSAMADRQDAFEDLREKERARLIALQRELAALARDVPKDEEWILLTLAQGETPRFWVDVTSHVVIGRDRRVYRFLRDTRLGRIVVCESEDVKIVARAVADFLAERIVERERAIDGDWLAAVQSHYDAGHRHRSDPAAQAAHGGGMAARPRVSSLSIYGLGIICGLVLMFVVWAASDPAMWETVISAFSP